MPDHLSDGPLHPATFWGLVERRADATPDAVAFEDEHGRVLTFGGYREAAVAVAAGLGEQLNIGRGSIVSWQLPTSIDAEVLIAALARIGAIQNPIIPILRTRDVRIIVEEARSDVLLVRSRWADFDHEAMALDATTGLDTAVVVIDVLPHGHPGTLGPAPVRGDERRWLYYTSGSTARPKGAWHSDESVLASMNAFVAGVRPTPDDLMPIAFPIAHIGGVSMLGAALTTGFRSLLVERFDFQSSAISLSRQPVTILGSALPFLQAFLDAQRAHGDDRLYPALRACINGGAPLPKGVHEEIRVTLGGIGVVNSYGLTEFPVATSGSVDDPHELLSGTAGQLGPGVEIRIVDVAGSEVGPGQEGELRWRGPQRSSGYADATLDADAFDELGYFRSGDLGLMSSDGYVTVTGRLKDIIIRNAENISATEIEDVLHQHPTIADAAVIGLPDLRMGERVCAIVQVEVGGPTVSLDTLRDFCGDQGLAPQKAPDQLEVVDAVPRTAMGKIDKVTLRSQYSERKES